MPPPARDNHDERLARIDMILEELRLNTEDLHALAAQAKDRALTSVREARSLVQDVREGRKARRAERKR